MELDKLVKLQKNKNKIMINKLNLLNEKNS